LSYSISGFTAIIIKYRVGWYLYKDQNTILTEKE